MAEKLTKIIKTAKWGKSHQKNIFFFKGWIYSPSLALDGLPLFLAHKLLFWVPVV